MVCAPNSKAAVGRPGPLTAHSSKDESYLGLTQRQSGIETSDYHWGQVMDGVNNCLGLIIGQVG